MKQLKKMHYNTTKKNIFATYGDTGHLAGNEILALNIYYMLLLFALIARNLYGERPQFYCSCATNSISSAGPAQSQHNRCEV